MKKVLSILVAVFVMTATFAQTQTRVAPLPGNHALQVSATTANPLVKTVAATPMEVRLDLAAPAMADAIDTIEIVIPNALFNDRISQEGWFQIRGTTEDHAYYATFSNSDSRTTLLGNYSYASFDLDWSYVDINGFNGADTVRVNVTDGHASMTSTSDGYFFEAYYVGDDDHCYHITMYYIIPAFENALDTVEVMVENPRFVDYTSMEAGYLFFGFNADSTYAVQMVYNSAAVAGELTRSDFNLSNTNLYEIRNGRVSTLSLADVKATVSAVEGNSAYAVDAWFLSDQRTNYHVTMQYVIPVATDTVEVNVPTAQFETVEGGWFTQTTQNWSGVSDDEAAHNVTLIYTNADVTGEFAYCKLDASSKIDAIGFVDGHLTVEDGEGAGDYVLEAYLIGSDLHCYHINMVYTRPTLADATDTIDFVVPAADLTDRVEVSGAFQFYGFSADSAYAMSVVVYSDQIPGTYTYEDFYTDYVFVVENSEQVRVLDGHATVEETASGYSVEAYLLGANLHCYHATMTYVRPVATDTIDVVIENVIFDDMIADAGWFQMRGWDVTRKYCCSFSNYDVRDAIAGTYSYGVFDPNYCYVVVAENGDTNFLYALDGHVTVTATDNGYLLEAWYLCEDLHCYHITMTASASGINDAEKVQVTVYPNPATDLLHVEADGITRIEIIDAAGRVALTTSQAAATLNVSGLANGVYMLRTTTREGVNVQRIVKK